MQAAFSTRPALDWAAILDDAGVPNQIPIGTQIPLSSLPNAASRRVVVMVVSDCSSCSNQVLKLATYRHEVERFVLTADAKLVGNLKKEWPGTPVVCDPNHEILPEYCYAVTPQMFLVEDGRVKQEAVGAIDCASEWDRWNQ